MNKNNLTWYQKLCLRIAPWRFLATWAKKHDVDNRWIGAAERLFRNAERIDIQPCESRYGRGFIVYLDSRFALFFYQDGDHFTYDGFEMGPYGRGDVTVFDSLFEK